MGCLTFFHDSEAEAKMPINMSQELATILLTETLRVGAAVLLVAGVALVASAILTQTMVDTSRYEGDPFAGFGFVGAVGLGVGAICTSIPMWTTFRAIRVWQRAIPPRDLQYQRPIRVTEGQPASIVPSIADAGRPLAQYTIVAGQLPSGLKINRRAGKIAGLPRLKPGDLEPGTQEAVFRVTVQASNLKGICRTTIAVTVRPAGAARAAGGQDAVSGGVASLMAGQQETLGGSSVGALVFPLERHLVEDEGARQTTETTAVEMVGGVWDYQDHEAGAPMDGEEESEVETTKEKREVDV